MHRLSLRDKNPAVELDTSLSVIVIRKSDTQMALKSLNRALRPCIRRVDTSDSSVDGI